MLGPEHCRRRAERLRFALLSTQDPVAAVRLSNFVEKYRALAERADKAAAVEHEIRAALSRKPPKKRFE
jgi:hypothetical protein